MKMLWNQRERRDQRGLRLQFIIPGFAYCTKAPGTSVWKCVPTLGMEAWDLKQDPLSDLKAFPNQQPALHKLPDKLLQPRWSIHRLYVFQHTAAGRQHAQASRQSQNRIGQHACVV